MDAPVCQSISLPQIPPMSAGPVSNLVNLLKWKSVAFAMAGVMLSFAGPFAIVTYLSPFPETRTHVTVSQLSPLLFGLGTAGFFGTSAATALVKRHLYLTCRLLPVFQAAATKVDVSHAAGALQIAYARRNNG